MKKPYKEGDICAVCYPSGRYDYIGYPIKIYYFQWYLTAVWKVKKLKLNQ